MTKQLCNGNRSIYGYQFELSKLFIKEERPYGNSTLINKTNTRRQTPTYFNYYCTPLSSQIFTDNVNLPGMPKLKT